MCQFPENLSRIVNGFDQKSSWTVKEKEKRLLLKTFLIGQNYV